MMQYLDPEVGICACGDTIEELAADVASEILFVWRAYALAPNDALSPGTLAMKAAIIERFSMDDSKPPKGEPAL